MLPTFLSDYLDNSKGGECSQFIHTWSCLSSVAAALGRRVYMPFGQGNIYPNMYVMLVGEPAAKKSSGIKLGKKLLAESGYETFVADSASREKFLSELANVSDEDIKNPMLANLKLDDLSEPAECFMAIDEFRTFMGVNNEAFITLLADFWDRDTDYWYKIKTGKSFKIILPTINLLGGTTAGSFHAMFPSAIADQGFLSRLILVHAVWNGVKVPWPPLPNLVKRNKVVNNFAELANLRGEIVLTTDCKDMLAGIYMEGDKVKDGRFITYNSRRHMQLFKLCILMAAMRNSLVLEKNDILFANTLLTYTESLMPKVLGEYGKAKYAEVSQRIIELLDRASAPVKTSTILKEVAKDLDKGITDLSAILSSLLTQEKIQSVSGGYLSVKETTITKQAGYVDWSMLTELNLGNET